MDYSIRELRQNESKVLNTFLYEAIFIPEGVPIPPKEIINQPELQVLSLIHISEPTRRTPISYAVFCLKKKKKKTNNTKCW